jgi:hypothetical protein
VPLRACGPSARHWLARSDRRPTPDLLAQFDARVEATEGYHWELRTRWLPALTVDAADVIIPAKARAPSPHCLVFWHHFYGAATRVAPAGTAFGMRNEHLMIEIVAGWNPDGDNAAHRRWAQDLSQSLAPFALPGGYANLLGPNDREQAAGAYGGNGARPVCSQAPLRSRWRLRVRHPAARAVSWPVEFEPHSP